MTIFVMWNQTPNHLEIRGPTGTLKFAPLQRRRTAQHPVELYGEAATAARTDQVVDWEPEPTRSTILRAASMFAVVGLVAGLVASGALLTQDAGVALVAAAVAVVGLLASAEAIRRGRRTLLNTADQAAGQAEPARRQTGFLELLRDLVILFLHYSAFVLLVVVGVSAPAAALYFGTDMSEFVRFDGLQVHFEGGSEPAHVLVVRCLQLVLVILVSLVPALMFFQFDREKLTTMVDRWLHVIFRLDPTLTTVSDVDAKYGRRVEEFFGTSLAMSADTISKPLRDRSPVVLSTLLIAIGWIIVVLSVPTSGPGGASPTVADMFHPLLTPVTMAFLGAYFLSVQVALRGFVRGDLKPKTYNVITVRILMAVVLAWVLQALHSDESGVLATGVLALSFLAGIVPSTVLLRIRSAAGKRSSNDEDLERRSPLTQIDEIDVYERTRLEEEGITSVQGLARHDLVDLMLSSRIPASRLIDWVDQAILRQHTSLEVALALRAQGVRCATDLRLLSRNQRALEDLVTAMGDRCSPTLLLVVLEHDEWLAYVTYWRENEDTHARKRVIYPLSTDVRAEDVRAEPAVLHLQDPALIRS